MHLYSVLLCIAVHVLYNHGGGGGASLLNHHHFIYTYDLYSRQCCLTYRPYFLPLSSDFSFLFSSFYIVSFLPSRLHLIYSVLLSYLHLVLFTFYFLFISSLQHQCYCASVFSLNALIGGRGNLSHFFPQIPKTLTGTFSLFFNPSIVDDKSNVFNLRANILCFRSLRPHSKFKIQNLT